MCVWNPGDQNELAEDASDKEWVVGYSVGHDRLGSAYTSARGDQACHPLTETLTLFLPLGRCSPARPSDDGGFDDVTEFCSRKANFRSKSAICFSASAKCFSASDSFLSRWISSCRRLSFSRLRRSFSRSSGRCSDCSGFARATNDGCPFRPPELLLLSAPELTG